MGALGAPLGDPWATLGSLWWKKGSALPNLGPHFGSIFGGFWTIFAFFGGRVSAMVFVTVLRHISDEKKENPAADKKTHLVTHMVKLEGIDEFCLVLSCLVLSCLVLSCLTKRSKKERKSNRKRTQNVTKARPLRCHGKVTKTRPRGHGQGSQLARRGFCPALRGVLPRPPPCLRSARVVGTWIHKAPPRDPPKSLLFSSRFCVHFEVRNAAKKLSKMVPNPHKKCSKNRSCSAEVFRRIFLRFWCPCTLAN